MMKCYGEYVYDALITPVVGLTGRPQAHRSADPSGFEMPDGDRLRTQVMMSVQGPLVHRTVTICLVWPGIVSLPRI